MIYLLRYIEFHESGSSEHRDKEFQGDQITVGRATDQDIQLLEPEVALCHAIIDLRGAGRAYIKAFSPDLPVSVNGKVVRRSSLQPGDTIQIGASTLGIFESPKGFDFAMTLERGEFDTDDEGAVAAGSQYITTLAGAGLRKRPWSWGLFLLILIAFFIIPASGLVDQRVEALLRSSAFLPDDGAWSPGALIAAHNIAELADHCDACHVKPFIPVRDEQCTTCHDDMRPHVVSSR